MVVEGTEGGGGWDTNVLKKNWEIAGSSSLNKHRHAVDSVEELGIRVLGKDVEQLVLRGTLADRL